MKHAKHAAPENVPSAPSNVVEAEYNRAKKLIRRAVIVIVVVILYLLVATAAYIVIARPPIAQPVIDFVDEHFGSSQQESAQASEFSNVSESALTEAEEAARQEEWARAHTTAYIANYGEVYVHSCIPAADLTGLLFHQASTNYALQLTTELPEANYEKTAAKRKIRVNRKQETSGADGDWLDADALHVWRTTDETAMDTSIDVGARPGTAALAPVTGTVVLVRDYMLYDQVPDVEIHIQPDGHPELDCVMIHTTDPTVKAGDHIDGGLTEICKVRDIEKDLTDVQLGFFTPDGVGGNHVHVQINDANYPNYRKIRLEGAIKVKNA